MVSIIEEEFAATTCETKTTSDTSLRGVTAEETRVQKVNQFRESKKNFRIFENVGCCHAYRTELSSSDQFGKIHRIGVET